MVRGRGEALRRGQPPPERCPLLHGHVHLGMALHPPEHPTLGFAARLLDEAALEEDAEGECQQHNHQRPADKLAERELPAEQQRHDDPQFDHQVGRRELKGIAAVKFAPLRKSERASATAAYEQEDEAAPRPVARHNERGESSGMSRRISLFDTTACTAPERAKPRISAQRISQNMPKAKLSASKSSPNTSMSATAISCFAERAGRRGRSSPV